MKLSFQTDLPPHRDGNRKQYKWMMDHSENLSGTTGEHEKPLITLSILDFIITQQIPTCHIQQLAQRSRHGTQRSKLLVDVLLNV